jgi:hypothetical protein
LCGSVRQMPLPPGPTWADGDPGRRLHDHGAAERFQRLARKSPCPFVKQIRPRQGPSQDIDAGQGPLCGDLRVDAGRSTPDLKINTRADRPTSVENPARIDQRLCNTGRHAAAGDRAAARSGHARRSGHTCRRTTPPGRPLSALSENRGDVSRPQADLGRWCGRGLHQAVGSGNERRGLPANRHHCRVCA